MMNTAYKTRKITFSETKTSDLLDRAELKNLREQMVSEIISSTPGTILCLDLSKIRWINSSGADEVIGQALRFLKESPQEVYLYVETEVNNYEHIFNIDRALRDAELPLLARVKTELGSFEVYIVGPMQPYLGQFLKYLYSCGSLSITSTGAAERLGISKNKCSTYLSKLFDLRLIKREKTTTKVGYEYVYSPIF
ncbi:hypothetical protein EHV15_35025 [Paenibacillus oralis]|uniref:Uncharacterized protein n=1 Tax=Paenibacillus oralis TaxID=2490856 RepID=A0A3P3TBA0_9BACL|nr:hypothetical protein [Paenibacillus oralis]RRJ54804.1 hypothetical protein EHV15_35025 [Paenibacillus oralis]